eukprot:jgi/Astpho2/8476/fgenesh1_pm.00125_%23_3_t
MNGRAAFYVAEGDTNKVALDDDGVVARTGNWKTASGHIITAVIGSGVLSLPWSFAQIGWAAAPLILFLFAAVTWYTTMMLADCYRYPDPNTGQRNYTYVDAVRTILGPRYMFWCGLAQYSNFIGTSIGYTITAGLSMAATKNTICYHNNPGQLAEAQGPDGATICTTNNNKYFIIFGAIQILFSQLPDMDRLWVLSILSACMSFLYSFIILGLSITQASGHFGPHPTGTAGGIQAGVDTTHAGKVWLVFNALGAIAFAFSFSFILVEIQDTIKPLPGNSEAKQMKKASRFSITATTMFYASIATVAFAGFGNEAPGNILSGGGFEHPFWVVALANIAVAIHLIGAYQVWTQPLYGALPVKIPGVGIMRLNAFRLCWRTVYVCVVTCIAALIPFFNDVVGFLGALGFWPLTIFFPVLMHIKRNNYKRFSPVWFWLQGINVICFCVSLAGAIGSIEQLTIDVQGYTPFSSTS